MSNPRAHLGHIIMAAGGVVLALSTFLHWLEGQSAWEAFSVLDIIITLGAIATAAIAAMHITGASANQPMLRGELAGWVGLIPATLAIALVLEFGFGPGTLGFGAYVAFLASLAIIAGLVLRERPDLAEKVNAATANIGGGGLPGAGPGAPGAPGGFAQQPVPPVGAGPASPGSPTVAQPAPAAAPQQPATAPQPVASPTPQPAQAESSGPAPGWYPDPQGQKRLRYWDGGRWTEQTAD
ncbi:MAG: hypothetical protein QOE06_2439 [Thermoleophilaceae bacterium]|nr:hypothetical protein [Thermoleophilaceae bacterium]